MRALLRLILAIAAPVAAGELVALKPIPWMACRDGGPSQAWPSGRFEVEWDRLKESSGGKLVAYKGTVDGGTILVFGEPSETILILQSEQGKVQFFGASYPTESGLRLELRTANVDGTLCSLPHWLILNLVE